jgi:aminopeptidase YwaD
MSSTDSRARLYEIAQHLSEEIGVRLGGTQDATYAAEYLAETLTGLGLNVQLQPFAYLGWDYGQAPSVELCSPEQRRLQAAPMSYAEATDGTIRGAVWEDGKLVFVPNLFEFVRLAVGERGERRASIFIPPYDGAPYPLPKFAWRFTEPGVFISRADGEFILAALARGQDVRVAISTHGQIQPDTRDFNVIARLDGESDERIIVTSHLDSALQSPGAVDNASGCAAMVEVARRLIDQPIRHTLEFAAFGAEEWGILGSEYFVLESVSSGEIELYRGVVNCDPVGAGGDDLTVLVGPAGLRDIADAVVADLGLSERYNVSYTDPHPGSDHRPFWERGVPACCPVFDLGFPDYHLPSDTMDKIDFAKLETIVDLVTGVVRRLDDTSIELRPAS